MITKYRNGEFVTIDGVPNLSISIGDRRYAQDITRDFWFQVDRVGQAVMDLLGQKPVLIYGGIVTQGATTTFNITAGVGYVKYAVQVPDSFASIPPSLTSMDVENIRIVWSQKTNFAITGYATGGTVNYVKVAYLETDGNTRQRARAAGTYAYEKTPDIIFTANSTPPTKYELCLATFTESSGTFTFTGAENTVREFNDHSTPVSYKNLVVKNTTASPNNQIDITYDNLQIGRIHATAGSFLAFNVETAGNWDTGTAAEPANGWVYVWMMAKIDGTCNPFYSLSATSPTMPSGYVFSKLVGTVRNTSGNFVGFYQRNNYYHYTDSKNIVTNGTATTPTAIDMSVWLPNYRMVEAIPSITGYVSSGGIGLTFYTHSNGAGAVSSGYSGNSSIKESAFLAVSSQNIYYSVSAGTVLNISFASFILII